MSHKQAGSPANSSANGQTSKLRKSMKMNPGELLLQKHGEQELNSNSFANRKQNNSWIAQSFRKAFGKIESKKKNCTAHKSQTQINSSSGQLGSNNKMMSSVSVNNTHLMGCDVFDAKPAQQQRSSCSGNSKCSSLSEDEKCQPLVRRQLAAKLSLPPSNDMNDTDSDYEEHKNVQYNAKCKNSSLITKRSYRSESELACKHQIGASSGSNETGEPQGKHEATTGKNCKTSYSKLVKTHKSVSSLLNTSNQSDANSSLQQQKLIEINQPYLGVHTSSKQQAISINEKARRW